MGEGRGEGDALPFPLSLRERAGVRVKAIQHNATGEPS